MSKIICSPYVFVNLVSPKGSISDPPFFCASIDFLLLLFPNPIAMQVRFACLAPLGQGRSPCLAPLPLFGWVLHRGARQARWSWYSGSLGVSHRGPRGAPVSLRGCLLRVAQGAPGIPDPWVSPARGPRVPRYPGSLGVPCELG